MKQEILDNLMKARRELLEVTEGVAEDLRVTEKWSVKDVLSHVVGWDFYTITAIEECLQDKMPFYFDLNWDKLNEEEVQKRRNLSLKEVLDELEQSHKALLDFVSEFSEDRLTEYHGHRWRRYKITPESLLQVTIHHDIFHARKIREAARHQ
ncbi:MAG: DinB family protein [Candidatus Methanofastidiosia archaeon]